MIIAFVLGAVFGAIAVILWAACAVKNKTRKK